MGDKYLSCEIAKKVFLHEILELQNGVFDSPETMVAKVGSALTFPTGTSQLLNFVLSLSVFTYKVGTGRERNYYE